MAGGANGYMKAYHCILDDALACLKPGEFSIFYFIYRKTIGWSKYVDRISYNQFVKETGLTRPTVFSNLASLEESKWIHIMREITEGGLPYNQYSLGELVYKLNQLQNGKETKPILVKKLNQNKPKVVKKLYPQKIDPKDNKNNDPYVILINKKCGTMWIPQDGRQTDNLIELENEFTFDTFKPVFLKTIQKTPTLKPPGVVSYMLKVLRNQPPPPKKLMTGFETDPDILAAKLKAAGIKTIPNPSQLARMEDDENAEIPF